MTASVQRYGQLAPVVACAGEGRLALVDGFKRLAAARKLGCSRPPPTARARLQPPRIPGWGRGPTSCAARRWGWARGSPGWPAWCTRCRRLGGPRPSGAETLARYPDISAVRLLEELRGQGFEGGYTIVGDHLRRARPQPKKAPGKRLEPGRGEQAQQDWSPYTIDSSRTGRARVSCFSLVLSFSRRQYIDFVEREDLYT